MSSFNHIYCYIYFSNCECIGFYDHSRYDSNTKTRAEFFHILDPLRQLFTGPSDLLVCFMTLNRLRTMQSIDKFYVESQRKMLIFSVLFSYITSIGINMPAFWGYKVDLINCHQFINDTLSLPHNDECYSFLEPNLTADKSFWKPYLAVYVVTMKILPAFVIICMNFLMIIKLRKIMNQRKKTVLSRSRRTISSSNDVNETDMPTISKLVSQNMHINENIRTPFERTPKMSFEMQQTRLTLLLITILGSFTILTTPNTVLQCYWLWGDTLSLWTTSGFNLRLVSAPVNVLLTANYSLNFYLYCIANKDIKNALIRSFSEWCKCKPTKTKKILQKQKMETKTKFNDASSSDQACGCVLHSGTISS